MTVKARSLAALDQSPLKGAEQRAWERTLLASAGRGPLGHLLLTLFRFSMGRADCFPSVARIASEGGKTPRTVKRLIKDAVAAGLVLEVPDGSIPTHRRFVFPTHPSAEAVLRQFPDYMQGCQNVTPPCTCRGDKNGTCRGDKNGRCRGDILSPKALSLKHHPETEIERERATPLGVQSIGGESGSREPEPDADLHLDKSVWVQTFAAEFVNRAVALLGPNARRPAEAAARDHDEPALRRAIGKAEAKPAKTWSYIEAVLEDVHAISKAAAADSTPKRPNGPPRAGERPLTAHQAKMAAYRAIANAPLTEEEEQAAKAAASS